MIKFNEVQVGDWIYFPANNVDNILLIIKISPELIDAIHVKYDKYFGIDIIDTVRFNLYSWRETAMKIDNPIGILEAIFG
jgi:hypothetical protein